MTRFRLVIVSDGVVYSSCEFNGDGYWSGYGVEVYKKLKHIKTLKGFKKYVKEFNNSTFQYPEGNVVYVDVGNDITANNTDYLYVKNIGNHQETFICKDETKCVLEPYEFHTFYFNRSYNKSCFNKIVFEEEFAEDAED